MSLVHSNEHQQAFVLHTRAFRETSLVVELFIRDIGRKATIAKGARRKKSQFSGVLEPFNQLQVSYSGRSDLATLVSAERCHLPVQLNSQRLFCGMYLNELILNLLTDCDPHQQLFDDYLCCVNALQDSDDLESLLRQFELSLLEHIGYGLQLECEGLTGNPVIAEQCYQYRLDQGLVVADRSAQPTLSGTTLLALSRRQMLTFQQRREAKQLLRCIIDHHLDGKPLRSRDLFRTIQSSL
ncbi:MAG TPA: DNA repair protein RecO [Crenotrichaceae bacterium]|nr:DNA repair protein RecO [Crenotrichaceae bacterium]